MNNELRELMWRVINIEQMYLQRADEDADEKVKAKLTGALSALFLVKQEIIELQQKHPVETGR